MARHPRIVVKKYGDLIEVTARTFQGRLLLRPSARLNEIVLGALGRGLERESEIAMVAFVFMSNHYHLLLRAPNAKALSEFVGYINGNIARKVNKLHGWSDKFWGRRYRGIQVIDDVSAEERLRYVLSHGAKEGLVARPGDWPGAHCHDALLRGAPIEGVWFDDTASYNYRRRGKAFDEYDFAQRHTIELQPLPGWEDFSEQQRRDRCAAMVADIEREAAQQNRELGRTPPGPQFILGQDPHARPNEVEQHPAPLCHGSTEALREEYREFIREFVIAYGAAVGRVRQVRLEEQEFPPGCFPPAPPFVPDVVPPGDDMPWPPGDAPATGAPAACPTIPPSPEPEPGAAAAGSHDEQGASRSVWGACASVPASCLTMGRHPRASAAVSTAGALRFVLRERLEQQGHGQFAPLFDGGAAGKA